MLVRVRKQLRKGLKKNTNKDGGLGAKMAAKTPEYMLFNGHAASATMQYGLDIYRSGLMSRTQKLRRNFENQYGGP